MDLWAGVGATPAMGKQTAALTAPAAPGPLWGPTCSAAKSWAFRRCSLGDACGHFSRVSTEVCWATSHPSVCDR